MQVNIFKFYSVMREILINSNNYTFLDGFLSELLREGLYIKRIIKINKNSDNILDGIYLEVFNTQKERLIFALNFKEESDFFINNSVTFQSIFEDIKSKNIKKVIAITILYQENSDNRENYNSDYIYHGNVNFIGLHKSNKLGFSHKKRSKHKKEKEHDLIFPEYYLIKLSDFNDEINSSLDEWIYFLKNGKLQDDFSARGIIEAYKYYHN